MRKDEGHGENRRQGRVGLEVMVMVWENVVLVKMAIITNVDRAIEHDRSTLTRIHCL